MLLQGVGSQDERGRAELGPPLLLTIWKRPKFILCLLNSLVQGLFFSKKFTHICDYTEQKFRLHQYWINGDDDTFVSAILD